MIEKVKVEWAYFAASVRDRLAPILYWKSRKARRERFAELAFHNRWKGVINDD